MEINMTELKNITNLINTLYPDEQDNLVITANINIKIQELTDNTTQAVLSGSNRTWAYRLTSNLQKTILNWEYWSDIADWNQMGFLHLVPVSEDSPDAIEPYGVPIWEIEAEIIPHINYNDILEVFFDSDINTWEEKNDTDIDYDNGYDMSSFDISYLINVTNINVINEDNYEVLYESEDDEIDESVDDNGEIIEEIPSGIEEEQDYIDDTLE